MALCKREARFGETKKGMTERRADAAAQEDERKAGARFYTPAFWQA
jgi:hypothetical protein